MDPTTLKAARVEQDLTQSELAASLNVSLATITSWECGRRNIHGKRKPHVERVLDLPAGTLGTTSTRRGPQPLKKAPAQPNAEAPGQPEDHPTSGSETNATKTVVA